MVVSWGKQINPLLTAAVLDEGFFNCETLNLVHFQLVQKETLRLTCAVSFNLVLTSPFHGRCLCPSDLHTPCG